MLHLSRENTELLIGHSFAESNVGAVRRALYDMAHLGIGMVTFEEIDDSQILHEIEEVDVNQRLDGVSVETTAIDPVVSAIMSFTSHPESYYRSTHVRTRNGSEGWHWDKSAKSWSGIRLLMQVENGGPDGSLAVVKHNSMLTEVGTTYEVADDHPDGARYIVAPYLKNSILFVPESLKRGVAVKTEEGELVNIEHPLHAGLQQDPDDGFRTIFITDIKLDPLSYLERLGISAQDVRTAA